MGISSTLFYDSNDSEKQTLHRRIVPSENQFEEQQERWNVLADYMITDLRDRSGCAIRSWLQGSYKFGTQVRPARLGDEYDIDLGVYFEWVGAAEAGYYEPHELKEMVQVSLRNYRADDIIEVVEPPKSRCSRIRFTGDFHIDLPAYHLDADRDARMLATEEDGWEDSDPKALYVWFVGKFDDQTRAKARRYIRYLKIWAALQFGGGEDRPSSTLLTVLAAEAVDEISHTELASDDDSLTALLGEIVERLECDRAVVNPASYGYEDLEERLGEEAFEVFLEKLREFRDLAEAALDCEDLVSAADKWSEAFQHFFPMPEVEDMQKAAAAGAGLPVRAIIPEVRVRAVAKNNRHRQWNDMNGIGPIPKECDVSFYITNQAQIPDNAVVHWMVRNEGDEAETTNDLGHRAGTGLSTTEHSAYRGTHYMDCVVRQYGAVVGMRRVPVTISGTTMPRRNPARRPAWVRYRGRR